MLTLKHCIVIGSAVLAIGLATAASPGQQHTQDDVRVVINPQPRADLSRERVFQLPLENGQGWEPVNHIDHFEVADGRLTVESTGQDPFLLSPPVELAAEDNLHVRLRLRSEAGGDGQIFWATEDQPHFAEPRSTHFDMQHDGEWHEYDIPIAPSDDVTRFRLDPATAAGTVTVDEFEVDRVEQHPLEIERVRQTEQHITAWVRYHGDDPADVTARLVYKSGATRSQHELTHTMEGPGVWKAEFTPDDQDAMVARVDLEATIDAADPVTRRIRLHRPSKPTPESWPEIANDTLTLRIHPRGLFIRIYRDGDPIALIGPTAMLPNTDSASMDVETDGHSAQLRGDGVEVSLELEGDQLHASVEAEQEVEALVTRTFGSLEQGLLPGVEYLGEGEWSSSKADIETDEHVRFAPPALHVTMPLLAFVTEEASVGMLYENPAQTQPVFASPNFIDGAADHRLALRGRQVEATLRFGPGWEDEQRLEDLIAWGVRTRGLPEVPDRPRDTADQWALSLEALHGVLRNADGWGHCAEESWDRRFFSDHASTIWRLTGEMPDVPALVRGGAHLPNDAAYFASGRAQQWLNQINGQAANLRKQQESDGSFRYDGEYARTHFENTTSGLVAHRAADLLTHARYTGDEGSLEAGLKSLEYMKRFRTPRGAQTWEMPLHTPDVLGAAHLVRAYVLGYRLTGEQEYLDLARRWAITGLPFLYQWRYEDEQAMPYAVIAVLGATNWRAPNWIGLPVQWCGLPYADALLLLAEHDDSFDWRKVAEGILVSGERQMYPDGEYAGTLPDSYVLESGDRRGPNINPCALVSLRLHLEGGLGNVAVARDAGRTVVSPYPVSIEGDTARIEAEAGQTYEIVVDGERIIEVDSEGVDEVTLD